MPVNALIKKFVAAASSAHSPGQPGQDEVHDVRVSIRRLDQGLKIFRDQLPSKRVRALRKRLKATLKLAGEVRDRDIALSLIEELKLDLDAGIPAHLESERNAASVRFVKALQWALGLKLDTTESLDPGMLPELAARILPKLAKRFIEQGAGLAKRPKSKRRLHSLRVSAKRMRYSLEAFTVCYGPSMEKRIAKIRKIQNALGDIQDCVAARRLLRDLGTSRADLKELRREEAKRVEKFQELWPKLFREPAAGEWSRYLKNHSYNGACPPQSKP